MLPTLRSLLTSSAGGMTNSYQTQERTHKPPVLGFCRKVFCNQFRVLDPMTKFNFQKCDQSDQPEGINV